jgi:hypothetical protein
MYNQKLRTFSEMMQMGGMPQEAAPAQAMPQQGMPQQGGNPEEMIQQLMQMVMQALQQGTDPQQIVSMLVEQGIPQDQAGQIVEATMQQMQGAQAPQSPQMMSGGNMQYQMGGLRKSPMEAMKNYISPEQYNYLKRFM